LLSQQQLNKHWVVQVEPYGFRFPILVLCGGQAVEKPLLGIIRWAHRYLQPTFAASSPQSARQVDLFRMGCLGCGEDDFL
jgi:hypothetical protein